MLSKQIIKPRILNRLDHAGKPLTHWLQDVSEAVGLPRTAPDEMHPQQWMDFVAERLGKVA